MTFVFNIYKKERKKKKEKQNKWKYINIYTAESCLNAYQMWITIHVLNCIILFSKEILYMYLIKIENSVTFRTVHNVLLYFVSLRLIYVASSSCPEAY